MLGLACARPSFFKRAYVYVARTDPFALGSEVTSRSRLALSDRLVEDGMSDTTWTAGGIDRFDRQEVPYWSARSFRHQRTRLADGIRTPCQLDLIRSSDRHADRDARPVEMPTSRLPSVSRIVPLDRTPHCRSAVATTCVQIKTDIGALRRTAIQPSPRLEHNRRAGLYAGSRFSMHCVTHQYNRPKRGGLR